MFNRKAIGKLKAVLLIDIIIVAVAAGTYLYLTNTGVITEGPGPAEFALTDFEIAPVEAEEGEPVTVSFNLTNVGESEGNYTVTPIVNDVPKENLTLIVNDIVAENTTLVLVSLESSLVSFTLTETAQGNYTVQVGELNGTFLLKPAPPMTSNIVLSNLVALPYEAWVGDPIRITAKATNPTSSSDTMSAKLTVTQKDHPENTFTSTQRIELEGGQSTTITFNYSAPVEGTYNVKVNNQISAFVIVPTGMHSLLVVSAPKQGIDLKIDGVPFKTPHTELLTTGVPHTIEFPAADPTGKFGFLQWADSSPPQPGDGSKNPVRQITLTERTTVKGEFSGGTSCPSLYLWNGKEWVYVQEVSNHGWLGYTRYVNEDGSLEYWRNDPWDYIPVDRNQLQLADGYYYVNLTQRWDEIFFLDSAYLVAVDHPAGQDVYSTMVEQYIDPNYVGKIYTVSENPLKPVSAFNELVTVYNGKVVDAYNKVDVLSTVSNVDGVFTPGYNGKYSQDWNNQTWNRLTVDLGDLSEAEQIKLVVRGLVDWGPADSYYLWMNKFYSTKVPNHTEPTPVPFMEVKDANGNWIRVPEERQIPLPPDYLARTYIVDLTGLFPTTDYSIRINNFWNVTYDFIGADISTQQDTFVQRIDPEAYLRQEFVASETKSMGSFTRYGDVTSLLLNEDDMWVIGRQGDSVALKFSADTLSPLVPGMERDFFVYVACWFKVEYANYGFGPGNDEFTVEPLPFQNMSGFPYSLDAESYPYDDAHRAYIRDYNTRVITLESQEASFQVWIPIAAAIAIAVANSAILIRFRRRSR